MILEGQTIQSEKEKKTKRTNKYLQNINIFMFNTSTYEQNKVINYTIWHMYIQTVLGLKTVIKVRFTDPFHSLCQIYTNFIF